MKIPPSFSIERARKMQRKLAVMATPFSLDRPIRYVGGIDVAYTEKRSIGAAVVLDYKTLAPVEVKTVVTKIYFPYVSTLLSLREIPPMVKAVRSLDHNADVYLVNGQGMLHPYRCGLATHFGVVTDVASIGVAKRKLCGEVGSFGNRDWAPISLDGDVVGAAMKTLGENKTIFVSIGHKVDLKQALAVTRRCLTKYALPEPLRVAHLEANKLKSEYGAKRDAQA